MLLLLALACTSAPETRGVYRAGPNAIVRGERTGEVLVWGPDGTVKRMASEAPGGNTFLGQAGPLWVVDKEIPAAPKAAPVDAALVERAGFRMQEVLGTTSTGATDAAKAGGVFVRSVVKVRRPNAPPLLVVSATGDEVGAGKFGGPKDVRAGANCEAAVALVDSKAEKLVSGHKLDGATKVCAVPVVVPPVDLDGDGKNDVLIHGQNGDAGFRAWFEIDGETLVPGPSEVWEDIP